jgi:hypothetical protein
LHHHLNPFKQNKRKRDLRKNQTKAVVVIPVVRIVPVAIGNPTVVVVVVPIATAKNASGFLPILIG